MVDRRLRRDCDRAIASAKSIGDKMDQFNKIIGRIHDRRNSFYAALRDASKEQLPALLKDFKGQVIDKENALMRIYYDNVGNTRAILAFFNDSKKRDALKAGLFKLGVLPEREITSFLDSLMFSVNVLNDFFVEKGPYDVFFANLNLIINAEKKLLAMENPFDARAAVVDVGNFVRTAELRLADSLTAVFNAGSHEDLVRDVSALYSVPKTAFDRIKRPFDERLAAEKAKGRVVEAGAFAACLLIGSSVLYGVYALVQPLFALVNL